MAKEELAKSRKEIDLKMTRRLVDAAHLESKEILVELREITRGFLPPSLDLGLEGALVTLVARTPIPADLAVHLPDRPTPAIETIAYFCVAELLANVVKHAGATRASVTCDETNGRLTLMVQDDGRGGAVCMKEPSDSSGPRGLTDRVQAVDGTLSIDSPLGGPTIVVVELPVTL